MARQRRPPIYSANDRKVIDVFKTQYLACTTVAAKQDTAKQVLAALFNHWSEQGIMIIEPTAKSKVNF
jgi:hypothetical protein